MEITKSIWQDSRKMALIGLIGIMPALVLVLSGVLFSLNVPFVNDWLEGVGFFKLAQPVVILGGVAIGVLLNLLPIVHIRYEKGVMTNTIVFRDHALNWGYLLLAGGVVGIIFLYLLAENVQMLG